MENFATSRHKWLSLILALLLATTAVSCGVGSATQASQAVNLMLDAASLDFGSVAVGSSKSDSITLTNSAASGGPSIAVSQITITGTGFSGSIPNLPLVLAAGQSATLNLKFSPTRAGSASGNLSIVVEGAVDAANVPLTGMGLAPGQISVSPSALDFGSVNVGNSKNLGGTLTAGNSNIQVSSASWNGQGYSLSGITFPVTVAAGKSVPFTVTFAPQAAGISDGSVSFVSDASNSPTTQTFTGNGVQPVQHSVDLSWNPSADPVAGYNVYRGTSPGGPYTKLTLSLQPGTSYTDNTVESGSTYFYVSTAVDANSQESIYSNEAKAVIPNP